MGTPVSDLFPLAWFADPDGNSIGLWQPKP
jgi:hypothetical protein